MSKKFLVKRNQLVKTLQTEKPELYQRIKILITSTYPTMNKYYNLYETDDISHKLLLHEVFQYLMIYDKKFLSNFFGEKIKPNRIEQNHLEFFKFNINDYENTTKYFIEQLDN
jgi:hypothetical protein